MNTLFQSQRFWTYFLLLLSLATHVGTQAAGLRYQEVEQQLVGQRWQLSSQFLTTPSEMVVDYMKTIKSCSKDDEYVFMANGTYQLFSGSEKCNVDDQELIGTGTWRLSPELELTLEFLGGKPLTRTINDINDANIQLSQRHEGGNKIEWMYRNADIEPEEELETEEPEAPYRYALMVQKHIEDRLEHEIGFVTIDLSKDDPGQRAEIRLARSRGKSVIGVVPFTESEEATEVTNAYNYECDLLVGGTVKDVTSGQLESDKISDSSKYEAIVEYELELRKPTQNLTDLSIIASNVEREEEVTKKERSKKFLKAGIAVAATAATLYAGYRYGIYLGLGTTWSEVSAINDRIDQQGTIDSTLLNEELGEQGAVMEAVIQSGDVFMEELRDQLSTPLVFDETTREKNGEIRQGWFKSGTPGMLKPGDQVSLSPDESGASTFTTERSSSSIKAKVKTVEVNQGRILLTLLEGSNAFTTAQANEEMEWLVAVND